MFRGAAMVKSYVEATGRTLSARSQNDVIRLTENRKMHSMPQNRHKSLFFVLDALPLKGEKKQFTNEKALFVHGSHDKPALSPYSPFAARISRVFLLL